MGREVKCICILVSGRVQGVLFRENVRRKALELALIGYVKNLSNGKVEIIAQGKEEKIQELIEYVKKSPGFSKVEDIQIKEKNLERLEGFEIRY